MWKKIFALISATTIALLTPPAIAEAPLLNMNDFSYGAELAASGSELRRFTLTPNMIKNINQQDLADIQIFDGNNELIPSLVRKKDGDNKLMKETLSFTRAQNVGNTTAYILDRTENHQRSLKSLSLQWKRGYTPNILLIRIEHSADKKSWKTLKESEAVNNFKFEGIMLKQNLIEINDYTQRYIQITFLNKKQSFVLTSVSAYSTDRKISDHTWIPAGKIQPQPGMANAYRFKLDEGIKPELFKLSFPSLNSILNGSLNSIKTVSGKLKYQPIIKNFSAYVVTINNKVIKSRPINISRWQATDWLIIASTTKNIEVEDLPGAVFAYPQYEMIFADNGEGPYTVVWGNSAAAKRDSGNINERIQNRQDIAEVKVGHTLGNSQLTRLMESRQTPWIMISISIASAIIVVVAFVFGYRRYQQGGK